MNEHMEKRISFEVSISAVIDCEQGNTEILDWQLEVNPPQSFGALPPQIRAAFWSKLRDEIEENWFSAALGSDPNAIWNWLLEDIDLG
jgi:hypothetical protein